MHFNGIQLITSAYRNVIPNLSVLKNTLIAVCRHGKLKNQKNLEDTKKVYNFASQNHSRVPWPSGEAPVCKTVYSSSILLGTSVKSSDSIVGTLFLYLMMLMKSRASPGSPSDTASFFYFVKLTKW